ncbi:MAG: Flp pilus assembly protein CpaB [Bacillota bacterium]
MTRRQVLKLILLPVLVGLVAVSATYAYLQKLAPRPPEEVRVVAAARAMSSGTVLTAPDLVLKGVPPSLAGPETLTDLTQAEGKVTLVPLVPGELVLRSKLVYPGTSLGLGSHLPSGYRAVTVAADEVKAVAWLLRPGDRVDVIATFPREVAGADKSRLLLEDVQVVAVGRTTEVVPPAKAAGGEVRSVTVAVTPEQAIALALAEETGRIRLALRPLTGEWTRGEIELTTASFSAGTSARLKPVPGPALRSVAAMFEVQSGQLAALGLGRGWPAGIITRDASFRREVESLVTQGKGRLIARRELSGGSGVPVRWELESSVPVSGRGGLAWISYGFRLEVVGVPADKRGWRLDASAELRYLDVPQTGSNGEPLLGSLGTDGRAEATLGAEEVQPGSERLTGTVTLGVGDCLVIHGLLGAQCLGAPDGLSRLALPASLRSDEVERGTSEMLVLLWVLP